MDDLAPPIYDPIQLLAICGYLDSSDFEGAVGHCNDCFPFSSLRPIHHLEVPQGIKKIPGDRTKGQRRPTATTLTQTFQDDGFFDRYTGERVVYPPALRLLSLLLPDQIPYHDAWKVGVGHPLFWAFSATYDHVIPITRGGSNDPSNLVTCSMMTNEKKKDWLLDELLWELHPSGSNHCWDGLLGWFVAYIANHPNCIADTPSDNAQRLHQNSIKQWLPSARRAVADISTVN